MKCLSVLLLSAVSLAVQAGSDITPENIKAFFDTAFLVERQDHKVAGAIISVVKDDQVVFKAGYGFADIENRVPADPDHSLFRIASISKPFIWTALLQLQEQGRLSIDDDVNQYLSTFQIPETYAEPVRIRDLLTHTAGFEDQVVGMSAVDAASAQSAESYLRTRIPQRVNEPGVFVAYSNWGTTLAGRIIEEVTGQNWDDYVDEHILTPLGMTSTNTHSPLPERFADRHAKGYTWGNGKFIERPYAVINDAPAGVISTTADDMTRFMIAHLGDGRGVLAPATTSLMREPLFEVNEHLPAIAYGFYQTIRNGETAYGHGGDINQFHSVLMMFPVHKLGVFLSFNSEPGSAVRNNVIDGFVDRFFPAEYLREPSSTIELPLDDYAGEYLSLRRNHSTIEKLATLLSSETIQVDGSELVVANRSRWQAMGEDLFTGSDFDGNMFFTRDHGGQISHVSIGSPFGTLEKVDGLDAPSNQRLMIALLLLLALVSAAGYGYRIIVPRPGDSLRSLGVLSVVHAVLIVVFYLILVFVLYSDMERFMVGVPGSMHWLLYLKIANCLLGLGVIYCCLQHWYRGIGSVAARVRLSSIVLVAALNLWFAYTFNILTYPFSNMPVF